MKPITIAHLSDIHYEREKRCKISTLLREKGENVETRLALCLEEMKAQKPDIIVITGDIAHETDAEDFRYVKEQFDAAFPDTPIFCAVGNHDIRKEFRKGFLGMEQCSDWDAPYYDSVIAGGYQFISMDSAYVDGLKGYFTDEAMDFLEAQLEKLEQPEYADINGTFLLMHHPIMERARHLAFCMNERLDKILKSGKIKGIFNGHVHGNFVTSICGVPQFTSEALSVDFEVLHDRMNYVACCGYQMVTFDEHGDWLAERVVLDSKPEILFAKIYS